MTGDRFEMLLDKFESEKIDGILVSSATNIFYLTGADSFSNIEREAYLFITESERYLFTDMRYIEGIRYLLPDTIKLLDRKELFSIIKNTSANTIGIENNLTVHELSIFKKNTRKNYKLTGEIVENIRAQKNEEEIALLRSATTLTDIAYAHILRNIKLNMTELEVAYGIEKFIKGHGGTLAFDTIVAFGPNSAIPHHKTSERKLLKTDEYILIDFGAKIQNYCSDMTRTILSKRSSARAKTVYETVYHSQSAAAKKITEGECSLSKILASANEVMSQKNFPDIPHGLGHGVGIEVHESPTLSPKSKGILLDGMVFTIEPGIYIPGFGGVRIEDDFLYNDGKLEQLTKSPKELLTI